MTELDPGTRVPLHLTQHETPIYDRLMAERDHRAPGTLLPEQEEELRLYAAEMAADPDPQIKESAILAEMFPPKPRTVAVVPLAAKLPDPEPIPGDEVPPEDPEEPEDGVPAVPEEPDDPQGPREAPEAVTVLLERLVPLGAK